MKHLLIILFLFALKASAQMSVEEKEWLAYCKQDIVKMEALKKHGIDLIHKRKKKHK